MRWTKVHQFIWSKLILGEKMKTGPKAKVHARRFLFIGQRIVEAQSDLG